jgi:hypothetical protein
MSGRIQASRGSVLFSTNAAEVFDDEANRQQLEQVSQQMEDAIQKEKMISRNHQVTASTHTWDTNKQMPADMPEERMLQSKTPEMNEINKEVSDQSRQHIGDDLEKQKKTNPIGFATDGPSESYNPQQKSTNENMSNPMDPSKVIDQVKGIASGAAGLATGVMNVAAGAAKVIQQSAKSSMDGTKDMMKPSNDTSGNTKDAEKQQEQRDRQGSNPAGATQAGETQKTSRGKQFSEHRQNASLL